MDLLGSECSSGCESGWTLYLEHSFLSHGQETGFCDGYWKAKANEEEEEEEEEEVEEDLSMVSDASSGPPQLFEDDACSHELDGHFSQAFNSAALRKKQKIEEYQCYDQPISFLDDTASSTHNFTNNDFTNQASMESFLDMNFSQTGHFQERSEFTEHFGFLQSSLSGNRLQKNQWFEGKGIARDEMR